MNTIPRTFVDIGDKIVMFSWGTKVIIPLLGDLEKELYLDFVIPYDYCNPSTNYTYPELIQDKNWGIVKKLEGTMSETQVFSFGRKIHIKHFSKEDQEVLNNRSEIELILSPQLQGFQIIPLESQFFEPRIKEVNLNINDFDFVQDHVEEVCHRYKNHLIKVKIDHTDYKDIY